MDKFITGHTSFETAYIQPDYPYGRTLRCQRAVWIETATKGQYKGQMRFCYRTTNPKQNDRWNKVHAEAYSAFVVMYIDNTTEGEIGYVKYIELHWGASVEKIHEFKAKWMEQLQEYPDLLKHFQVYERYWNRINDRAATPEPVVELVAE